MDKKNKNPTYEYFSHSRVETFNQCAYKFKLHYVDKLRIIRTPEADCPLILGLAVHTGIEKGVRTAVKEYYNSYPIINDTPFFKKNGDYWQYVNDHVTEVLKLEYFIKKALEILPENGIHELKIETDSFVGYVDYLASTENNNEYDLYDFKYCKNADRYVESKQLHIYKYYLELQGYKIRNMYYLIIPKMKEKRKKKKETLETYHTRIFQELKKSEQPYLMKIEYDYRKPIYFLNDMKKIKETTNFKKNKTKLCNWCEYQTYCETGDDVMLSLPKNEVTKSTKNKKKLWLYGEPYSGKTTFASQFPNHLFLTTDGNIERLITYDASTVPPHISLVDKSEKQGRVVNKTLAWELFKEAITVLELKENDFQTIICDHLSDLFQHCRTFIFEREGITHESEEGIGKGWDLVQTEFLQVMRRFVNLDYDNIIIISHEDRSRDITKKGGDKITAIRPQLRESFLSKIAGMVDITARAISEDNVFKLSFKTSEVIFGGGRLSLAVGEIPQDYEKFIALFGDETTEKDEVEDEQEKEEKTIEKPKRKRKAKVEKKVEIEEDEDDELEEDEGVEESKPIRKKRKRKSVEDEQEKEEKSRKMEREVEGNGEDEDDGEDEEDEEEVEEKPRRKRRSRTDE